MTYLGGQEADPAFSLERKKMPVGSKPHSQTAPFVFFFFALGQ